MFPEEWDDKSQSVILREKQRLSYVMDVDRRIRSDIFILQNIIKSFPYYSVEDILQSFHIHGNVKIFLALKDNQIRLFIKNIWF